MLGNGIITFGPGVSSINGATGSIVFAGVSGIFIDRQGQTIYIGMSGIQEIVKVSGHYTTNINVDSILVDASVDVTSPIVVTLPDADEANGNKWDIKKIDETAGTVMISGINSGKVDIHNTILLTEEGQSLSIIASQSQYWII